MNQMNVWGMTDIGLVRKENQDAYVTAQHTASGRTVGVVCDGMGGPAGGRVASQIAVSVYLEELEKLLTADQTPQQLLEASAQAAALANQAIQAEAERREECRNMGTTLVSAISYDGGVVVTNVGDSRAYHITEDGITRITKDHSLVESMVDRGDITAEEARRHPSRNLITRALGPDISADCDGYICPMNAGRVPAAVFRRTGEHRHRSGDALRGHPRRTGRTPAWTGCWPSPSARARRTMSRPS